MDRFNDINLGWAYLALLAAGVVLGAATAAVTCVVDWARRRRT